MSIISIQYNNSFPVSFTQDAWINATQIAKQYNKKSDDYLRLDRTKDYITALKNVLFPKSGNPDIEQNQLFRVKKGAPDNGGGTWFHPKLAIDFARWLNADFAVWCDMQIEKLLHPAPYGLKELPPSTITEEMQHHIQEMVKAKNRKTGIHWQTIYDQFKTHFEIPRYDELPITKYAEACLYFGSKAKYDLPQYVSIDVRELEELRSSQISNLVIPTGELAISETRYLELVQAEQKLKSVEGELIERSQEIIGVKLPNTGRVVSSGEYVQMLVDASNEIPSHDLVILPKKLFLELKKALANVF